jgi:hypothetical protein
LKIGIWWKPKRLRKSECNKNTILTPQVYKQQTSKFHHYVDFEILCMGKIDHYNYQHCWRCVKIWFIDSEREGWGNKRIRQSTFKQKHRSKAILSPINPLIHSGFLWISEIFSLFTFFFSGSGVWTQGFALTKQIPYCLSHTSNPFFSRYFGDGVL